MNCPDCPHPAHAGRCFAFTEREIAAGQDWRRSAPQLCLCTRRTGDGMDTTPEPSGGGNAAVVAEQGSPRPEGPVARDMRSFLDGQARWDLAKRYMNHGGLPPSLP